jgi:hypothetical protein
MWISSDLCPSGLSAFNGIICLSICVAETPRQSLIKETPDILRKDSLCRLHHRLTYGFQVIKEFQPIKIWTGSL